jgi:hypothetical protein
LVCAPVGVHPQSAHEHRAVLRDISVTGASFLTRVELTAGEPIRLTIYFSREPNGTSCEAEGSVVRVEALEPERADVWSHEVAVRFGEPLSGCEAEILELAARLVRAGLPW